MENRQSDMKFASDPTPFAFTNERVDGGYYVLVTGVEDREFNMVEHLQRSVLGMENVGNVLQNISDCSHGSLNRLK